MKRNRLYSALSLARGAYEIKSDPEDGGGNGGGGGTDAVKEIKTLIQTIGRNFEDYKKSNDERIAAIKKGLPTGDIDTKLANIEKAMQDDTERKAALDKHLAELEKSLIQGGTSEKAKQDSERERKLFNAMRKTGPSGGSNLRDLTPEEYASYKEACAIYLRKGSADAMSDPQRKAMIAGDDPNGGFFLPAPDVGRIVERVFELSPIRSIVDVQAISAPALEGINDNDEAAAGWVGETDARPDTATPKIGKYRIEAHEMYAQPKASQTLLDDSAVDVEGWLARKVASKFARLEGAAFVSGNGVNQPRGFTTYTMDANNDDVRAWGTIQYVKTGTNGSLGTNADILFDLIAAFRTPYLNNAKFVTRREIIAMIRKLKGAVTGDYLWQPGLQAGQPDKLLGYPIITAQDLPAANTNGDCMWFGDWQEFYTIVDRVGIRVLRDPYTDKPYIKFYTTRRVGGGVLNYEAVKSLRFST